MLVFAAYFIAGKLGQATTNIRSSNLGPVWPAFGIAVASFIGFGYRIWPAIASSAFLVAFLSPVPALAAAGQAAGATGAAAFANFLVRRVAGFDPTLPRLRDAVALIMGAAFGSAVVSATIGMTSLYLTHVQPYSGIFRAWLIYWLGDSTGVMLLTPLVFTLPMLLHPRTHRRTGEVVALLTLSTVVSLLVFGDFPLIPVRLDPLAFAVLPFVMWAAIDFGIAGASLSVLVIATIATLATAFGSGPFAENSPFVAAVLLDVLFIILAVSGLTLAAVIAERERAESGRVQLARERSVLEARQQVLWDVNRKLIEAQEQERRRIARELHDDIGQRLALLTFDVDDLMKRSTAVPGLHHKVGVMRDRVTGIAADVQALSHELHSAQLELLGLTAAIKSFCATAAQQQNAKVDFETSGVPEHIPEEIAICLFRVLQEGVHNAIKHSGVRKVTVRFSGTTDALQLVISDRGAGFDADVARSGDGIGLISMAERIKLVDGDFEIESKPRHGTTIRVRVPLPDAVRSTGSAMSMSAAEQH